jgi:hypothetical protein
MPGARGSGPPDHWTEAGNPLKVTAIGSEKLLSGVARIAIGSMGASAPGVRFTTDG